MLIGYGLAKIARYHLHPQCVEVTYGMERWTTNIPGGKVSTIIYRRTIDGAIGETILFPYGSNRDLDQRKIYEGEDPKRVHERMVKEWSR